jgi:hypothetical protein
MDDGMSDDLNDDLNDAVNDDLDDGLDDELTGDVDESVAAGFGPDGDPFAEFEEDFAPPPEVAADIAAITEANEEFYNAAEAGDLDRLGAIWLSGPFEASVQCVHPGWAPVSGREDVLRSWAVVCANTPFLQFFLTDVRVDVVDRIAVVSLTENIITDMSAGSSEDDPGFIAGGRATTINLFRRTEEGWRLWMHHASAVMDHLEDSDDSED